MQYIYANFLENFILKITDIFYVNIMQYIYIIFPKLFNIRMEII